MKETAVSPCPYFVSDLSLSLFFLSLSLFCLSPIHFMSPPCTPLFFTSQSSYSTCLKSYAYSVYALPLFCIFLHPCLCFVAIDVPFLSLSMSLFCLFPCLYPVSVYGPVLPLPMRLFCLCMSLFCVWPCPCSVSVSAPVLYLFMSRICLRLSPPMPLFLLC
jgi:hypothetical protein